MTPPRDAAQARRAIVRLLWPLLWALWQERQENENAPDADTSEAQPKELTSHAVYHR
jgi:hypothetical protein